MGGRVRRFLGCRSCLLPNVHDGILIQAIDSTGNLIQGNRIGTNAASTAALGNGPGVDLNETHGNTIGGTAAGAGNVISGNNGNGIVKKGVAASLNLVQLVRMVGLRLVTDRKKNITQVIVSLSGGVNPVQAK